MRYDLAARAGEWLAQPNAGRPHMRFNEGKCDRRGRFWAGTMADAHPRKAEGTLYRLAASGEAAPIFGDISCPNCIVWTADDRYMYFADTPRQRIQRFPFDLETGTLARENSLSIRTETPACPMAARWMSMVASGTPSGEAAASSATLRAACRPRALHTDHSDHLLRLRWR